MQPCPLRASLRPTFCCRCSAAAAAAAARCSRSPWESGDVPYPPGGTATATAGVFSDMTTSPPSLWPCDTAADGATAVPLAFGSFRRRPFASSGLAATVWVDTSGFIVNSLADVATTTHKLFLLTQAPILTRRCPRHLRLEKGESESCRTRAKRRLVQRTLSVSVQ